MSRVTYLVFDEADRMLDMGFKTQFDEIVEQVGGRLCLSVPVCLCVCLVCLCVCASSSPAAHHAGRARWCPQTGRRS